MAGKVEQYPHDYSRGGASRKMGPLARRWIRFWMKRSGTGPLRRLATRLAAWGAPPHLDQVSLAYMSPTGYIDPATVIHHGDFRAGNNVYLAPRVLLVETSGGGVIRLGDKVAVHRDVILETGKAGRIEIGAGSSIHPGCQLKSYIEPIQIGEGVMIAGNVAVYSYDHGIDPDMPIRSQPIQAKAAVVIGDDAWVGTGAIILSGVTIGEGAVVAAGAVVTRDVPPGGVVGGNPARLLKHRAGAEPAGVGS